MARDKTVKRRPGRPTKQAKPDAKSTLGVRVSPALKDKLLEASEISRRSLSQEAELRLEQSFYSESLLNEALLLRYDRPLAGVLLFLAETIRNTILHSFAFAAGDKEQSLANLERWYDSPFVYEQVCLAVAETMEMMRPPGVPEQRLTGETSLDKFASTIGRSMPHLRTARLYGDPDPLEAAMGDLFERFDKARSRK